MKSLTCYYALVATYLLRHCSASFLPSRKIPFNFVGTGNSNIDRFGHGQILKPIEADPEWKSDAWEGDDLRFSSRFRRRLRRGWKSNVYLPGRSFIFTLNVAAFILQTISTVHAIRVRYPGHWRKHSLAMIFDALWGSATVQGLFTTDFIHSAALSARQPHRYLTAGFLHGGLIHLLLNMDSLLRMPTWLESGLGTPLYMTTYLACIIAGNLSHAFFTTGMSSCVGASAGLTGLYGLMYVCLVRMGNSKAASLVLRGMAIIILYGFFISSVSNAAHIGGFIGGVVLGILCGPSYVKSYAMRRKWSLEVDFSPRDYRGVMGFGIKSSMRGFVPLTLIWVAVLFGLIWNPSLRRTPWLVIHGLLHPGFLTRTAR